VTGNAGPGRIFQEVTVYALKLTGWFQIPEVDE
jgi:hypothetical protein